MSLKLSAIFGNVGVGGRKAPSAAEALRMEYDMMNMQNVDDVAILTRLGVSRDGSALPATHGKEKAGQGDSDFRVFHVGRCSCFRGQ